MHNGLPDMPPLTFVALPAWVVGEDGQRYYRGTPEHTAALAERQGPSPQQVALAQIEELTALNVELLAQAIEERARAEEAASEAEATAAPLLERLRESDGPTKGGR